MSKILVNADAGTISHPDSIGVYDKLNHCPSQFMRERKVSQAKMKIMKERENIILRMNKKVTQMC
jgi:hypothetical protein